MDTQMQNFWVESINKEAALRLEWQLKYSKTFAKAHANKKAQEKKEKEQKGTRKPVNSNISKHIKLMEEKLAQHSKPSTSEPAGTSAPGSPKDEKVETLELPQELGDMYPPSAKTRARLYEGISHHGEGRYAYLKKRQERSPEEKYVFPIMSSCVYGWKILDYGVPKCSPFARTRVVRDTFYRHSGIITG